MHRPTKLVLLILLLLSFCLTPLVGFADDLEEPPEREEERPVYKSKSKFVGEDYMDFFAAGVPDWKVGPSSLLLLSGLGAIADGARDKTSEYTTDKMMDMLKNKAKEDGIDYLSSLTNGGMAYVFTWDNGDGPEFSLDNTARTSDNFWLDTLRPKVDDRKFLQIKQYIKEQVEKNPNFAPVFITDKILADYFHTGEMFEDDMLKIPEVVDPYYGQGPNDACLGVYYPPSDWQQKGDKMLEISGVYATMMIVSPVVPDGFDTLSQSQQEEWLRTHHPQSGEPRLTDLGLAIQKSSKEGTFRAIQESGPEQGRKLFTSLSNAISQKLIGEDYLDGMIELTPENRKGFARGGAFTVTRLVKRVSITYDSSKRTRENYGCQEQFSHYIEFKRLETCRDNEKPDTLANKCYHTKYRPVYVPKKVVTFKDDEPNPPSVVDPNNVASPYADNLKITVSDDWVPDQSFQVIAVRCNSTALKNRLKDVGGEILQDERLVTVGKSQVVENDYAKFFNDLPMSFYYSGEECKKSMTCSTHPRQALKNSDAKQNQQSKNMIKEDYGAQLNYRSSNRFNLKKNGQEWEVRVDIPTIAPKGQFPELLLPDTVFSTVVVKRPDNYMSDGFLFQNKHRENLFETSNQAVLEGEVNRFYVRNEGTSDEAETHKFMLRYDYIPIIVAQIPIKMTGTDIIETAAQEETIFMSCPVVFSETDNRGILIHNEPKQEIPKATGFVDSATRQHLTITYTEELD